MSPSLCATLQGWHLHLGLLAWSQAIGLEFGSRHKASGTWRTCTHTSWGPNTCQQDGLEEKGGELGCWLAQHRSPTQMCPSLEYIQSKIPNNGFQDTSVWTGLSFPSLDTSQVLFWGTDGEPQDLQPVATGVAGKAQVGLG